MKEVPEEGIKVSWCSSAWWTDRKDIRHPGWFDWRTKRVFGHGEWTQYHRPTGLRKYGVDHHFSVLGCKLSWPACPSTGWPSDSEWSWRFGDPISRLCRGWHEVTWFGCFTISLLSRRRHRIQLSSSSADRNQHPQQDPGWSGECTWSLFRSEGKPSKCNELCPLSDTDSPEDSRQEEECHQWG